MAAKSIAWGVLCFLLIGSISAQGPEKSVVRPAAPSVLPSRELLEAETFWDNRDWNWYEANIPFFECPDRDLQTTYYYRWELLTKHLTYGSPNWGYSFTEFIDRPFWSGAFGAISCPAGHQLYESRWLRDPQIARDYARYWLQHPGAQPRNYSTWLGDAIWALERVHPDPAATMSLLPGLVENFQGWEKRHFVPAAGLFWQTGHDDGMEYNINSRQTQDIVRGAPGFRPTLNSYLWADAQAIAKIADQAGQPSLAAEYRAKADALKAHLQQRLWDPQRKFFFHQALRDEEANGFVVRAGSWTHQSGQFAGSPFGRELIGYVPWQFSLPDPGKGYEVAWQKLFAADGFAAPFGPTTVERRDPLFLLQPTCCWWSGQSWPYATSQTLKALAHLLQEYPQQIVTPADYWTLLQTFARTHRKNGRPYLAEACHPDTGSFAGHDSYNHSEHYFHSSFIDLIVTGLVGLRPRDDEQLEVHPLAPDSWDYFALDRVPYRGRLISVLWDRSGRRYGRGAGFSLWIDGNLVAQSPTLRPLTVALPGAVSAPDRTAPRINRVNFAVNNDGAYYPRIVASSTAPGTAISKLIDGNYWYHRDPPNRWTSADSAAPSDTLEIDFGIPREIDTVRLYFLDDSAGIVPPADYHLEAWQDGEWIPVTVRQRDPAHPAGRQANHIWFSPHVTERLKIRLEHAAAGRTGLTEVECWGPAERPVAEAAHPAGNLAYHRGGDFPQASASHSDRFGGTPEKAIDGRVHFQPHPLNRWTSFESPNSHDWLELDWGKEQTFNRIELAIYDDRGGVQPPKQYWLEIWDGARWRRVVDAQADPVLPVGGQANQLRFPSQTASKLRVVFEHASPARSGISEILVWND